MKKKYDKKEKFIKIGKRMLSLMKPKKVIYRIGTRKLLSSKYLTRKEIFGKRVANTVLINMSYSDYIASTWAITPPK